VRTDSDHAAGSTRAGTRPASTGSGRLTSLDGLRGLAAFIVVVHHCVLALPSLADQLDGPDRSSPAWWMTYTPAHLLWAGVTTLRGLGAPAVPALVDPVLRALRLLPPASDVENFTTKEIHIHVRPRKGSATFYAHDGELERRPAVDEDGRYTLSCRILPSALRVYAPHPEPGESGGAIPVGRS
jgi:hypothetical protein